MPLLGSGARPVGLLALVALIGSLGLHAESSVDGAGLPDASLATGVPSWAPPATAKIHPGIQTVTAGAQCTANFVFYRETSPGVFDLYIGQAAHCASLGSSTSTNGCTTPSLPVGTAVNLGTGHSGTIVYSSWKAMQTWSPPESDPNVCAYNDFALVKIHPLDKGTVNPRVPFFGGPTAVAPLPSSLGTEVNSYGNSGLRFGIAALSPKEGVVVGSSGAGWSATVYTETPGIPGDSGSGFTLDDGKAVGVLSTLQLAPLAGGNGVGSLKKELDYMATHGGPAVTLGTAAVLTPGLL